MPAADPRPLVLLNMISRVSPGAWKLASDIRREAAGRCDARPLWPNWCYLPLAAWMNIAAQCLDKRFPSVREEVYAAQLLSALGPWRYTQGIYRFHPVLYDALRDTGSFGDMPAEVLYRLPEWCLYIETPGLAWAGQEMHGFFAHLEHDAATGRPELFFLIVPADATALCISMSLHMGAWTVAEAIDRAFSGAAKHGGLGDNPDFVAYKQGSVQSAYPLISLLLYLCGDEPEVVDPKLPDSRPHQPKPAKIKRGWELFPAKCPRVWDVGNDTGQKLERALASHEAGVRDTIFGRKSPVAHVRRAHWHGYWSGSMKEDAQADRPRRYHYHWLPPVIVGGADASG